MRLTQRAVMVSAAVLLAGCSSYSTKPVTTVLPTSNRSIDIVLHRGDVRVMDCATLAVLQTYNAEGGLIDSKEARGTALHCTVIPALIDAGGRVGAAAAVRPAITTIKNAVSSVATGTGIGIGTGGNATATGGNGGNGGEGGAGGTGGEGGSGGNGGNNGHRGHGNNGGGNGDNDGTNNGTDHHHDNGDNN